MEKYKLLYQDSKSVRKVLELPFTDRIEAIGLTRYTEFDEPSSKGDMAYLLNGAYPLVDRDQFDNLYGKVLTIVDASFPDGTQKDAFKTLIKGAMSDWYQKNVDYVYRMTEQLKECKNGCNGDTTGCSDCPK